MNCVKSGNLNPWNVVRERVTRADARPPIDEKSLIPPPCNTKPH